MVRFLFSYNHDYYIYLKLGLVGLKMKLFFLLIQHVEKNIEISGRLDRPKAYLIEVKPLN